MDEARALLTLFIPLLGMTLSFIAIIVIIIIVSKARTRRAELQGEMQSKLIERFGSSTELVAFLQSKAGQDFIRGVRTEPGKQARDRAAGGIRTGIFFSAIGLAFLILWPVTNNEGLAWPGTFLLILGLAFFASSYSLLRFSRERDERLESPAQPPAIQ